MGHRWSSQYQLLQYFIWNWNIVDVLSKLKHLSLKRFSSIQTSSFVSVLFYNPHNINGIQPEDQNIIVIIIK